MSKHHTKVCIQVLVIKSHSIILGNLNQKYKNMLPFFFFVIQCNSSPLEPFWILHVIKSQIDHFE